MDDEVTIEEKVPFIHSVTVVSHNGRDNEESDEVIPKTVFRGTFTRTVTQGITVTKEETRKRVNESKTPRKPTEGENFVNKRIEINTVLYNQMKLVVTEGTGKYKLKDTTEGEE